MSFENLPGDQYCKQYSRWPDGNIVTFANNVIHEGLKEKLKASEPYDVVYMEDVAFMWFEKESKKNPGQKYQHVMKMNVEDAAEISYNQKNRVTGTGGMMGSTQTTAQTTLPQTDTTATPSTEPKKTGFNAGSSSGSSYGGKSQVKPFVYTHVKLVQLDLINGWAQDMNDGFNVIKGANGVPVYEKITELTSGETKFYIMLGKRKYL